jgi:tRNA dimethylallyltransferase
MYIEAATRGYRLTEVPANDKLRMEFGQKTLQELQDILASMKKMHNISDLESPARALRAIEIETYYLENPAVQEERPPIRPVFIGVRFERAAERERITRRLYDRLASGMVEEVRQLLNSGISPADMMYYGLEYKFITRYLCGELAYDTMVSLLNTAIHQYAKRQRTWFRKMEKEGITIHWIDGELPVEKKTEIVLQLLETP